MIKSRILNAILLIAITLTTGFSASAQGRIDMRRASSQKCTETNDKGMKAEFSFGSINSENVVTDKGTFSMITMDNAFNTGEPGEPSLPSVHKLIAIPYGVSNVKVSVDDYNVTEYALADYGINNQIMPQQLSARKDQKEVEFKYKKSVYQSRGSLERELAQVKILGTLRGIQIAALEVNPVSYSPNEGKIKVFNDIKVTVKYGEYDKAASDNHFKETYSPYFSGIYNQLFNAKGLRDTYSDNPDLWQFPVKMLVITNSMFESALQPWVEWKTMKGFHVDVHYTSESAVGTTSSSIQNFIKSKYQSDAPSFVVVVGDVAQVPASMTATQTETDKVSDLKYYSTDSDYFPEMLYSRMSVENAAQLTSVVNKILMYEKYTFPDDSYLANVLLIAGEDDYWNPTVGQPTINYAANNYFNTAHGMNNVYKYLTSYNGCYSNLSTGVGFANYTAHGSETGWSGPSFSVSMANSLTNTNKPFIAMGNCCLAANFGYSSPCLAEALLRGDNKGAVSYIGSCPETYWWEDYYFGVGATNVTNQTPSLSNSAIGFYDTYWQDETYNTLSSLLMFGNLSVTNAHALGGYETSVTPLYYWQAYHIIGDGSIMPYNTIATDNNVNHLPNLYIGFDEFEVSADPGSYVAITKDGVILGAATVPAAGTIKITITPVSSSGTANLVVTRQQRKPYITTLECVAAEGPFITVNNYTPKSAHVGDLTDLTLTMKNIGFDDFSGNATITLSSESNDITFGKATGSFGDLASDATTEVSGFTFTINANVADGTIIPVTVTTTSGNNVWTNTIKITAGKASLEYAGFSWKGSYTPGETINVTASFKNVGHFMAQNTVATISSNSQYVSFPSHQIEYGTILPDGTALCNFDVAISANCPATEALPIVFSMTDNEGNTAQGEATLSNKCNIVVHMMDSYGDGWNGATLKLSFNDGTAAQTLNFTNPCGYGGCDEGKNKYVTITVNSGTTVTVKFNSGGSYDYEISYDIYYEDEPSNPIHSETDPSTTAWNFTVSCGGDTPAADLKPVENLTATVEGSNNVVLTWDAPTRATALVYTIYRTDLDEPIGTTQQTSFTDGGVAEGTYYYIVEVNYAEGNVPSNPVKVEITDGISESSSNVSIFPNPAKETIHIVGNKLTEVRIYNLYGQEVRNIVAESDNVEININGLSTGIYVVKASSKNGSNIQRIVVE